MMELMRREERPLNEFDRERECEEDRCPALSVTIPRIVLTNSPREYRKRFSGDGE